MKPQQGYIVRNCLIEEAELDFFSNTPFLLSPTAKVCKGAITMAVDLHPFIILLTYETKHIYIKCS